MLEKRFLTNNRPLDVLDRAQVEGWIEDMNTRRAGVSRVSRADGQELYLKLRGLLERVKESIHNQSVFDLPPELWELVFDFVIQADRGNPLVPATLAGVSKSWRTMVAPRFWGTIEITTDAAKGGRYKLAELLSSHWERAGIRKELKLLPCVSCVSRRTQQGLTIAARQLSVVTHLHLDHCPRTWLSKANDDLSSLESLVVGPSGWLNGGENLNSARKLTRVVVPYIGWLQIMPGRLPFLTHLDIRGVETSTYELPFSVAQCEALTHLKIHLVEGRVDEDEGPQQVHLVNLKDLTVVVSGIVVWPVFAKDCQLQTLEVEMKEEGSQVIHMSGIHPALTRLYHTGIWPWDVSPLRDMLKTVGTDVETVQLRPSMVFDTSREDFRKSYGGWLNDAIKCILDGKLKVTKLAFVLDGLCDPGMRDLLSDALLQHRVQELVVAIADDNAEANSIRESLPLGAFAVFARPRGEEMYRHFLSDSDRIDFLTYPDEVDKHFWPTGWGVY